MTIVNPLTDWLTDWLTDLPILTEWLADWDWLNNWLRLTDWVTDWLRLTYRNWVAGWLRLTNKHWLTDWMTDWLRLSDWLTDWLTVTGLPKRTEWLNWDWLTLAYVLANPLHPQNFNSLENVISGLNIRSLLSIESSYECIQWELPDSQHGVFFQFLVRQDDSNISP
jgi:hypothetical protein